MIIRTHGAQLRKNLEGVYMNLLNVHFRNRMNTQKRAQVSFFIQFIIVDLHVVRGEAKWLFEVV